MAEAGPSGVPMEVVEAVIQPPLKRRAVDLERKEVPDPKRNRAPPQLDVKSKVWKFIIHIHEAMKILYDVANYENIDTYTEITSHVLSMHNRKRQELNGRGGVKDKVADDTNMPVAGVVKKVREVRLIYEAVMNLYEVVYAQNDESRKVIGTLSAILSLIACYKDRFNEVRVGMSKVILGKTDVQMETSMAHIGLEAHHQISFSGINYTPSKQSAMKASLGPMTVVFNLIQAENDAYKSTWKKVFSQVFKLIPNVTDIADILAGSKGAHPVLIRHLADLCYFGITRSSHKAHFPMAMVLALNSNKNNIYRAFWNGKTVEQAKTMVMPRDSLCPNVLNLDFSGHGALAFWNATCALAFRIKGAQALTEVMAGEVVFHAVWGTHTEDLGYLRYLTEHQFVNRRAIGDRLLGRGQSDNTVMTNMIPFRRFAKLASAALNNVLAGGSGQIGIVGVFSGKRRIGVDLDSPLMRLLSAQSSALAVGGAMSVDKLNNMLIAVKDKIRRQIELDRSLALGTTEHVYPVNGGVGDAYGEVCHDPPVCDGTYFYNN